VLQGERSRGEGECGEGAAGGGRSGEAQQEEIVRLVQRCRGLSAEELEASCNEWWTRINGRRLSLPPGPLRQLYMRLLFILTRYTRFLQFSAAQALPDEPGSSSGGKGRRGSGAPGRSPGGKSPLSSPQGAAAEQPREASGSERHSACQALDVCGRGEVL